jgi:hypothetical protein
MAWRNWWVWSDCIKTKQDKFHLSAPAMRLQKGKNEQKYAYVCPWQKIMLYVASPRAICF